MSTVNMNICETTDTLFKKKLANFPTIAELEKTRTSMNLKNRYDLYCYILDRIQARAIHSASINFKFTISREEVASNFESGKYGVSIHENWRELVRVFVEEVQKVKPEIKLEFMRFNDGLEIEIIDIR
jgi:hypothetical protein